MKKKKFVKAIKILIMILLPLLAGVVIGNYAYRRYQGDFFYYYMKQASDTDSEERLIAYLKYFDENLEYEGESGNRGFFFKKDISKDGKKLFTLAIIRGDNILKHQPQYNKIGELTGYRDEILLLYHLALYNVNYENLAWVIDSTGEHGLAELPQIQLTISDKASPDDEKKIVLQSVQDFYLDKDQRGTEILDYGSVPEKHDDLPLPVRYYVLNQVTDKEAKTYELDSYSDEINFNFKIVSGAGDNEQIVPLDPILVSKMYNNKQLKTDAEKEAEVKKFKKGFAGDIHAAGYNSFVFEKYLWWEVLIAVVIFAVATGAFVLVWNGEDQKEKKK